MLKFKHSGFFRSVRDENSELTQPYTATTPSSSVSTNSPPGRDKSVRSLTIVFLLQNKIRTPLLSCYAKKASLFL